MQSAHKVSRSNSNTRCASLRLGMKSFDGDFYCSRTIESEGCSGDLRFSDAECGQNKRRGSEKPRLLFPGINFGRSKYSITMPRLKRPAARNRSGRWSPLLHTPVRHRQATPTRAVPSHWHALAPRFRGLSRPATKKLALERLRDRAEYENGRRYLSVRRRGVGRYKTQPAAGVGGKLVPEGKARIVLLFFVLPLVPPVMGCTPIAITWM